MIIWGVVGFMVGLYLGRWVWRPGRSLVTPIDRGLLLSISHLLEDAEAGLSSIEGTGEHRSGTLWRFVEVKSKVCLAQTVARNLLGVEQRIGRGADVLGGDVALDFGRSMRHRL